MTGSSIATIAIILAAIGATLAGYYVHRKDNHDVQIIEEKRNRKLKEKQEKEDAYRRKLEDLISKFGQITQDIKLLNGDIYIYDLSLRLLVFEESETVLIEETPISFNKILAFSVTDNQQTIATTTGTAETDTSTGSMAGRAIVGGVLLGGLGALAGVSSASKSTELSTTTTQETLHDYKIYLTVDDLTHPQRVLTFGKDVESTNKAAAILNIIIKRNKK